EISDSKALGGPTPGSSGSMRERPRDVREGNCYVERLHRNAQLAADLGCRKNAADAGDATGRVLLGHQGVLAAPCLQRRDNMPDLGMQNVLDVEHVDVLGADHQVAHAHIGMLAATTVQPLDRSLALR